VIVRPCPVVIAGLVAWIIAEWMPSPRLRVAVIEVPTKPAASSRSRYSPVVRAPTVVT